MINLVVRSKETPSSSSLSTSSQSSIGHILAVSHATPDKIRPVAVLDNDKPSNWTSEAISGQDSSNLDQVVSLPITTDTRSPPCPSSSSSSPSSSSSSSLPDSGVTTVASPVDPRLALTAAYLAHYEAKFCGPSRYAHCLEQFVERINDTYKGSSLHLRCCSLRRLQHCIREQIPAQCGQDAHFVLRKVRRHYAHLHGQCDGQRHKWSVKCIWIFYSPYVAFNFYILVNLTIGLVLSVNMHIRPLLERLGLVRDSVREC
ncbi:hypothetical protein HDE_13150 [Halotydeus destructor]|nr:hypothetical protein HDE_13150 [Halotydeus destructor]